MSLISTRITLIALLLCLSLSLNRAIVLLQTKQNTETRSYTITANSNQPTNSADIAINTNSGSVRSSSSVSTSGPGATASSTSTVSVSSNIPVGRNTEAASTNIPAATSSSNAVPSTPSTPSTPNTNAPVADASTTATATPSANDNSTNTSSSTSGNQARDLLNNYMNKYSDISNQVQGEITDLASELFLNLKWNTLNIQGIDISASNLMNIYIVGTDNNIYLYNPVLNTKSAIYSDNNYIKVIANSGQLFAITKRRSISFLKGTTTYSFESCTNDLAVSDLGEIYKLGCDTLPVAYPLYKLRCSYNTNYYTKLLDILIGQPNISCEWVYQKINAMKIALGPFGTIYAINADNKIEAHSANGNIQIIDVVAKDLAVSKNGLLYVVHDNNDLCIHNPKDGRMSKIASNVSSVTAGILDIPMYIDTSNNVFIPSQMLEVLNR
jgi:hypothetical protein